MTAELDFLTRAKKSGAPIRFLALAFAFLVPAIGYFCLGFWPALLFLIGYLSGYFLWLTFPARALSSRVNLVYWFTFGLFVVHRIEERVFGFFKVLSEITGVPIPEVASPSVIALLLVSIPAWLFGPFLAKRGYQFGFFLIWTFFASMGITELAHFIFPFALPSPYGYFPGMASVFFLAPSAWYGMSALMRL